MKKAWLFKLILFLIIIISCALLAVSVPILLKILVSGNTISAFFWKGFRIYLTNLYFGSGVGIVVAFFSMLRLENENQIKLVRFLLILSTMMTAITYILLKSIS